mgnify:CR=1 FL=1
MAEMFPTVPGRIPVQAAEEIGRVPDVGDRFQADGLDVCVTRVEHRRVMEIRVRPLPPEKEEPEKAHAHSGT